MTLQAVEVWTEEPSMRRALEIILPAAFPDVTISVYNARNKLDLLHKLPGLMTAYARWAPSARTGVVAVIDRDQDDCKTLLAQMDAAAAAAGLSTASVSEGRWGVVLNRLAIEELEAWFIGDVEALSRAYPGVSRSLGTRARFRDPDAVPGGTWEALHKVLLDAGHHRGGMRKIQLAEDVAPLMNLERNRSHSLRKFIDGLHILVNGVCCA